VSYRERYLAFVFIVSALVILLVSSFAWINNDQSLLSGIGVAGLFVYCS
jgi:hypothetical protein